LAISMLAGCGDHQPPLPEDTYEAGLSVPNVTLDAFRCDRSEVAFPCPARFTLTRVPGHAARHPSPVTVDVIAPGVPAGDCMPTSSSVRAPWGVPTADEPAAVLSARCREPEAAATAWLVLVRTGGDEAALSTGL